MEKDIRLEDVLEHYHFDDALEIIANWLQYRCPQYFIKRLVADLRDEDFNEYKELMEELKELGEETNKIGEYK